MTWNPWKIIADMEKKLEQSESARLRLEDDNRAMFAHLQVSRESEAKARDEASQQSAKFQDWLAMAMGKPAIHGNGPGQLGKVEPVRRPVMHGADIERELTQQFERELGIDQPN